MSVWMTYAIVITGIAYLAAVIAEYLLWMWRVPRRSAWFAALIVGIAAPVLIPMWYGASSHAPAMREPSVILATPPRLTIEPSSAGVSPARRVMAPEPARFTAVSVAKHSRIVDSALPTVWLGASVLLLCWAVISYARLKRQSATWREVNVDGTPVVVSHNCGPAVFGIWRQRIVIPNWALSLDRPQRALMLRHEREHLQAHDGRLLLMAMCAALLFPWNALLWIVVKRLRLAIELDCDDRVLRGDTDPGAYGSLLLSVCARRNRELPFAVALAERSSMLERRIRAMTAVTPRRRLLMSIPLLVGIVMLSAAAARTPSPQPFSLGRHRAPVLASRAVTNAPPAQASKDTAESRVTREKPPAQGIGSLPRLTNPESLPLMSANWENAPIENVIAAFAAFTHRRIATATSVGGLVTATVFNQPWPQALELIMARQGLRVEFRADSSIYIAPVTDSDARSRDSEQAPPLSRAVSGTVADALTGAPIGNARINIAGAQLIDSPNETRSDEQGHFALRVPDGEVWLDACASGYEFHRVTLSPLDTVAQFRGDRTGERVSSDTVRINRKEIDDIELIRGRMAAALKSKPTGTDVIQLTTKDGTTRQIPIGPEATGPVLVIDGAVVHTSGAQTIPCVGYTRGSLWFKIL